MDKERSCRDHVLAAGKTLLTPQPRLRTGFFSTLHRDNIPPVGPHPPSRGDSGRTGCLLHNDGGPAYGSLVPQVDCVFNASTEKFFPRFSCMGFPPSPFFGRGLGATPSFTPPPPLPCDDRLRAQALGGGGVVSSPSSICPPPQRPPQGTPGGVMAACNSAGAKEFGHPVSLDQKLKVIPTLPMTRNLLAHHGCSFVP